MKFVFSFIFTVCTVWPLVGWAGEDTMIIQNNICYGACPPSKPGHYLMPSGYIWHVDKDGTATFDANDSRANCLATMEAANKAIEPYLLVLKSLSSGNYDRVVLNGFDEALKQWAEAKTCWK